jgi:hypothetical protein
MTALEQYIRLEAIGLWQETPDTPEREVVVSFGNASLVLSDTSDRPLAHWSLVGTRPLRVDPDGATVYSTTLDGYETLAIRDAEMIRAIAAVSAAERFAPRPKPPRYGRWIAVALAVLVVIGLAWVGPPAIRWQAARMLPPEWVERFGDEMLLQVMGTHGAPCAAQAGQQALRRLADPLARPERPRVRVLDLASVPIAVLPSGYVLLDSRLIALAEGPEEIAGWIALGQARGELRPPAEAMMADAGLIADLRYILTGRLSEAAIARAAEGAVRAVPTAAEVELARERLVSTGLPFAPLQEALMREGLPAGSTTGGPAEPPPGTWAPLLTDGEWEDLKAICSGR